VTAVAVFRNPNTIPFCLTTDSMSLKKKKKTFLNSIILFKMRSPIFVKCTYYSPHGATNPCGPGSQRRGFTITLSHTTLGRTRLDEWWARRRDLYLPTHNIHQKETSMSPGGIRTRNPSTRAAADPHLTPRTHCYRSTNVYSNWLTFKNRASYI